MTRTILEQNEVLVERADLLQTCFVCPLPVCLVCLVCMVCLCVWVATGGIDPRCAGRGGCYHTQCDEVLEAPEITEARRGILCHVWRVSDAVRLRSTRGGTTERNGRERTKMELSA